LKILVLGKRGQLASTLRNFEKKSNESEFEYIFLGRDEVNFENLINLEDYFKKYNPEIVINAVGYTAVDLAESHPLEAYKVNAISLKEISIFCKKYDSALIHISTDYVFDGKKTYPYEESDKTNPINVYGKSKLLGEKLIQKFTDKYLIFRVSWVYSGFGKNFLNTIIEKSKTNLELNVVNDQFGGPTSTSQIVKALRHFCEKISNHEKPWGIYHLSGEPHISWHKFAEDIISIASNYNLIEGIPINPISSDDFKSLAIRPKYSALSNVKIKSVTKNINYDYKDYLEQIIIEKAKQGLNNDE
jgi:dTDP-4-dehydrorhamnose reductase